MDSQVLSLTDDEMAEVAGGIVPLILAAAVAATTVEFAFVAGIFDGIYQKETSGN